MPKSKRQRLQVEISEEDFEALGQLRGHVTRASAVRRAIRVYLGILKERDDHGGITLLRQEKSVKPNEPLLKVIVF